MNRPEHSSAMSNTVGDEYLDESGFLIRSPENARRLLESIERLENGGGTPQELLDPEA